MEEVWKDMKGYEGLYKVSNLGNVYSHYVNRNLKPSVSDGYKFVILNKNGNKKFSLVHRLVAEAFIPNPNNLPVINHKDENRLNSCIDNLEWCDHIYNATYNNAHIKRGIALSSYVYGYDIDGKLAHEYYGIREAGRKLNISDSRIADCCNNKVPVYKDIVWSYKKLNKQEVLSKFEEYETNKSKYTAMNMKNNKLSKRVNQYDLEGNFICSYPSMQEAARQLGFSLSSISGVCRGKHKQTHGFKFEYA